MEPEHYHAISTSKHWYVWSWYSSIVIIPIPYNHIKTIRLNMKMINSKSFLASWSYDIACLLLCYFSFSFYLFFLFANLSLRIHGDSWNFFKVLTRITIVLWKFYMKCGFIRFSTVLWSSWSLCQVVFVYCFMLNLFCCQLRSSGILQVHGFRLIWSIRQLDYLMHWSTGYRQSQWYLSLYEKCYTFVMNGRNRSISLLASTIP